MLTRHFVFPPLRGGSPSNAFPGVSFSMSLSRPHRWRWAIGWTLAVMTGFVLCQTVHADVDLTKADEAASGVKNLHMKLTMSGSPHVSQAWFRFPHCRRVESDIYLAVTNSKSSLEYDKRTNTYVTWNYSPDKPPVFLPAKSCSPAAMLRMWREAKAQMSTSWSTQVFQGESCPVLDLELSWHRPKDNSLDKRTIEAVLDPKTYLLKRMETTDIDPGTGKTLGSETKEYDYPDHLPDDLFVFHPPPEAKKLERPKSPLLPKPESPAPKQTKPGETP